MTSEREPDPALELLASMLHEDYHVRTPGVIAAAECDELGVHGKRVAELIATPSGARLLATLRAALGEPRSQR